MLSYNVRNLHGFFYNFDNLNPKIIFSFNFDLIAHNGRK